MKKSRLRFDARYDHQDGSSSQCPLTGLGKPIWVRGQVRVSIARVERVERSRRAPWLVKGEHLQTPPPFLLPVLRSA